MGASATGNEPQARGTRMLRTALGGAIADWLAEPTVIEIMLNPDGRFTGNSRSSLYLLIAQGEVEIVRVGSSTLVLIAGLRFFIERRRHHS